MNNPASIEVVVRSVKSFEGLAFSARQSNGRERKPGESPNTLFAADIRSPFHRGRLDKLRPSITIAVPITPPRQEYAASESLCAGCLSRRSRCCHLPSGVEAGGGELEITTDGTSEDQDNQTPNENAGGEDRRGTVAYSAMTLRNPFLRNHF